MQSGKKPVNCIPCAKRKVRCDRNQPCHHCKRRRGDACVYPTQRVRESSTRIDDSSERIEKLETYIRRLGGDPRLLEQAPSNGDALHPHTASYGIGTQSSEEMPSLNSLSSRTSFVGNSKKLTGKKQGFVEDDEQITYTEVPMWYSWSGVKKPEHESQAPGPEQTVKEKPKSRLLHCFPTLLDPMNNPATATIHRTYPPTPNMIALWRQYLESVHPLVMIFFDWEIEPIVLRAAKDANALTHGEQVLVFAILLIAIMSLSEEQCLDMLHEKRSQALTRFQEAVESSLLVADFIATSDRLVLQAFMLYLLRARPAEVFALLGVATRIAERMGLHHDGDDFGIPVLRSEERRRMWWQLQQLECTIAQLVGSITMTIYAEWDTKLPRNLEDRDLRPNIEALPSERHGLTGMSHCLWQYQILKLQRDNRGPDGKIEGIGWLMSPHVSLADKSAKIDMTERTLNEMFLQHCEPLEPLHTLIQIGVRSFVLAARRLTRQPALVNAKISEMSSEEREDFLRICTKSLEYYILLRKTESLRKFQWYSEVYSQLPAFVYVILEAHHRYDDDAVEDLWSLIGRVYAVHPRFMGVVHNPDIVATVRITVAAWQRRYAHVQRKVQERLHIESNDSTPPAWISELCQKFDLPEVTSTLPTDLMTPETLIDTSQLLPFDFDFDSMDWSFWQDASLDAAFDQVDT